MTHSSSAGEQSPHPQPQAASGGWPARQPVPAGARGSRKPQIKVASIGDLLAVIPHLLGFHPDVSLVVVALTGRRPGTSAGRIKVTFRYDLPDPPDPKAAGAITEHAVAVLHSLRIGMAVIVGYGPGRLVTPLADRFRAALPTAGITLRDVLRVEDGRYWSYLCGNPGCCPAEGVAFESSGHPATAALRSAGRDPLPDRAALAATIAPVTGLAAESMELATARALDRAGRMFAQARRQRRPRGALRLLIEGGRRAVREAIAVYRDGGQLDDDAIAWLSLALTDVRVRDDAWARMDPRYQAAHQRLWTDVVRRARPRFVPAPASLLAFTAWQAGDGALANIAVQRALEADSGYSMARLIGRAVEAGLPPSAARLPMTPEEVEASYDGTE
jgi:hypothetical protein